MDLKRAREIVKTLADGVNPATGEVFPSDHVYNEPDVIRALFTLLEATSQPSAPIDPKRNAGKPWNKIEDEKLCDEFASKMKLADIAKEHGRTYGAIESRLDHLGLKKKPFWLFKHLKSK